MMLRKEELIVNAILRSLWPEGAVSQGVCDRTEFRLPPDQWGDIQAECNRWAGIA